MDLWIDKNKCTGCGVCSNICPKSAIKMVESEDGFKYPLVDKTVCINCGLCKNTCPIIEKKANIRFKKPRVYAGWSKSEDIRYTSTSGGLFTEITKNIINQNGYVIGASYDNNNMVEHKIVNSLEGLEELKQSKYLQSDTKSIYRDTKKLLDNDKKVAFCGSPCQIAALYKYLKKEYKNLLTIEFICRGMNSPKAYRSWLSEIEHITNKKIKKVWFKYKVNGWKKSPKCTRLDFTDGTYEVYNEDKNTYMCGYLGPNLYIRRSCENCQFNGINRQADITLADFWGIKKELDDDKGTSMILVNSEIGLKYFNDIKENIIFEERDIEEIYAGNVCFNTSVKINKKSERFLKELNETNFSTLVNKYSKVSILHRVKNKIKKTINNFKNAK